MLRRKVVPYDSKSDLPLLNYLYHKVNLKPEELSMQTHGTFLKKSLETKHQNMGVITSNVQTFSRSLTPKN